MTRIWQPDVTVAAICEQDGRFLLVEERAKSSQQIVFNQPAGHLENGESVIEAVVRETLEETCRHFVPAELVGFYRLRTIEDKTYLRFTFCGQISEIDPKQTLDPDIIANHWLSYEEICQHSALRSALVKSCIDDYLAGQRYPLEILKEL